MKNIMIAGALALGLMTTTAQATPVQKLVISPYELNSSLVVDVREHRRGYRRGYRPRHRYGYRGYRYGAPRRRHYRRDYGYGWVPFAFGLGSAIIINEANKNRIRNHIAWCVDRYNSYDVESNTWVDYSGRTRTCRSPYN